MGAMTVIYERTVPAKYGFYMKLANHTPKSKGGATLRFENNRTLEERAQEKHLGYTKHLLIEHEKATQGSIKILWRQNRVEVDGIKVAWLNSAGEFKTTGVADQIKEEVEDMVKNVVAKRGRNSTSD